jgi:DNA-binding transcriptional MerR regulator
MDTDSPTFSASVVCAALGLSPDKLNTWAHRGLLRQFQSATTSPGVARRFTVRDVLHLGIMARVNLSLGIPPERAVTFAIQAVDAIEDHGIEHIKQVVWILTEDSEQFRFNDDVMKVPRPANPLMTLEIELKPILDDVKQRLQASEGGND